MSIHSETSHLKVSQQIQLACLMEAAARKPGNVHPLAAFDDLRYEDFSRAAHAIASPLAMTEQNGLGTSILAAVRATRQVTSTNVNLGIVLLLAPLAAVPKDVRLQKGIERVLVQTTIDDARNVYLAINSARPGGMAKVADQDLSAAPTVTLRAAMELAADRDLIAKQYVTNFQFVFEACQQLCDLYSRMDWESAVIALQIWMLSKVPDSLIQRKCGSEVAAHAQQQARFLIECVAEGTGQIDPNQLEQFDNWLRSDGHRRNPGTIADLIAATLFTAIRDDLIIPPSIAQVNQHIDRIRLKAGPSRSI